MVQLLLIDENMPIVIIAPKKGHYDKIVSNVQEIKARKGKLLLLLIKETVR
jgi:glucosamine--fructose-6-phosphate aminotransferase (isomerizing)